MLTGRLRRALASCVVTGLLSNRALAYSLVEEKGPALYYVQGKYRFHADQDASMNILDMRVREITEKASEGRTTYLHIGMVPLDHFARFVENHTGLCHPAGGLARQRNENELAFVEVPVDGNKHFFSKKLAHGGEHMLVIVNCQVSGRAYLSGRVVVKSSWGYLESIEYAKVPIYVCALFLSVVILGIYVFLVARQEAEVRDAQYFCILLGCMNVMESVAVCTTLHLQNIGLPIGSKMQEGLYLMKLVFGLSFAIQTAEGLGLTTRRIGIMSSCRCYSMVLLFLLAARPKICFFDQRPHLAFVEQGAIGKVLWPVVLVANVFFVWVSWSLGSVLNELRERDDTEALQACWRVAMLLLFVTLGALAGLCGQVFGSVEGVEHIFWNDAVPSAIFITSIATSMALSLEDYAGKAFQISALPIDRGDVSASKIGRFGEDEDEDDDELESMLGIRPETVDIPE